MTQNDKQIVRELAKQYMEQNLRSPFYEELHKALLGYISDKLAIQFADMQRDTIKETLQAKGVSEANINAFMQILEDCEMEGDYSDDKWKDVSSVEVAQYCTFFENLYMLHRHHIANIEDLDDLFGYRFFLFINNPYIQKHYLLPTSSSYVQIFELYKIWTQHRKSESKDKTTWSRSIPCSQYMISEDFMSRKLYLYDRGYACNRKELLHFEAKGKEF